MEVPREREVNIEYAVRGMRELSGPGFAFDECCLSVIPGQESP
jgi:hypothetical protein